MLTGSFASTFYGEPRATHDVDLVVQLTGSILGGLVEAFPPPDYHLDLESARDAVRRQGMFNLIDVQQGDKVDFWMLTDSAFDRSRFKRRRNVDFGGFSVSMPSPEDVILAKLDWSRLSGGSEKQIGDVTSVYELNRSTLDLRYLEEWVARLGLTREWGQVLERAQG